jgi:hypothetical protein
MNSLILPLPVALIIVKNLSTTKVSTVSRQPIKIGTMIPPRYIRARAVFAPSWLGQKPPLRSGFVKLSGLPIKNLQIKNPIITQAKGAIQEIELPLFAVCTLDAGFAAAVAVGLVSAMIVCF